MTKQEALLICAGAVDRFGERHQMIKAVEELGELQTALARLLGTEAEIYSPEATYKDYLYDNVQEEIADVEILLLQLRMIFDDGAVAMWRDRKLEDLKKRTSGWRDPKLKERAGDMVRTAATPQSGSGGSAGLESEGFAPAGHACAKAQRRDCYCGDAGDCEACKVR